MKAILAVIFSLNGPNISLLEAPPIERMIINPEAIDNDKPIWSKWGINWLTTPNLKNCCKVMPRIINQNIWFLYIFSNTFDLGDINWSFFLEGYFWLISFLLSSFIINKIIKSNIINDKPIIKWVKRQPNIVSRVATAGTAKALPKLFPDVTPPIILPVVFGNHVIINFDAGIIVEPGTPKNIRIVKIYNDIKFWVWDLSKNPIATKNIEIIIVFLGPYLSKMFPIKGEIKDEVTPPKVNAKFTSVLDQPNSSSNGIIKSPNTNWVVPRTVPIEIKDTNAIYHPW